QEVEKHLAENPFRQEEWDFLREKVGEEARSAIENDPFLAYGATLLLAAVTETYLLCMQLGDGDILAVDAAGVAGRLVAKDDHVELIPFRQAPPALVLISTDGYSNSYASEEGFLQTGPDYLRMIRSEGIEAVQQKLQGFLEETSRKGSGDDITLGMIKRSEKQDWDCFNLRLSSLERDIAAKASIEQLVSSRAEEDEKRAEGSARNEKHLEDTSEDLRELIKTQAEHNNEINQKLANTQAFLQVIDRKSRSLTRWVLIAALISLVSIGLIIYLLLR
ncbi:MAG: protein phosphatase 2C domain-containing protein, partial [Coprothermobacterota bacterium]|nr:protein phosphatase 2C domain-containing protein [Coprothermobacterota bacterium]